jgi:hypothetical protein
MKRFTIAYFAGMLTVILCIFGISIAQTPKTGTLTVTEQPDYIILNITCVHRTKIKINPGMCVVEGVDP